MLAASDIEHDAPVHSGIQSVGSELDEVEVEFLLEFQRQLGQSPGERSWLGKCHQKPKGSRSVSSTAKAFSIRSRWDIVGLVGLPPKTRGFAVARTAAPTPTVPRKCERLNSLLFVPMLPFASWFACRWTGK